MILTENVRVYVCDFFVGAGTALVLACGQRADVSFSVPEPDIGSIYRRPLDG